MFLHFETFDSSGKLFLSPGQCWLSLPALSTRVVKMGAWLTVIDGLNVDHSLPLQAHSKHLLFVTQEQWGFIQEMDVGCIYNIMLVWLSLNTQLSFPRLTQAREGDTCRWAVWLFRGRLKVCKLCGVFGLFFFLPYWRTKKHDLSQ